ncbi:MAG: NAD(P)H-hydrate dehydratase [Weeksellaceae bacterium]
MVIKTSDTQSISKFMEKIHIPTQDSHKGQNGKVLIIGGSQLFHAASLWAAEIATHFNDMVHYASTHENNEIMQQLKSVFRNGIVIPREHIDDYMQEDDAILIGPGMVRDELSHITNEKLLQLAEIVQLPHEAEITYRLTEYLLKTYPDKRYVLDAGALQMMNPEWLLGLKQKAIVTPHQLEFERLFKINVSEMSIEEKEQTVMQMAKKYNCVILLKAIVDIVSDGLDVYRIEGGNQGLTKGGSGDILAGLTVSLYTQNDPLTAAIVASYVEKHTADVLEERKGYWYNMSDLIDAIPEIFTKLHYNRSTNE